MKELMTEVLTNASARQADEMEKVVLATDTLFSPWQDGVAA